MKKFKAQWGFSAPTDVKPPKKKFKLTPEVIQEGYDSFEPNIKKMDFGKQEILKTEIKPPPSRIDSNPLASMVPVNQKKKQFDLSSAIALGLSGVSSILPTPLIKNPVVQPYENYSYNPAPDGNNSQALMKNGGKVKYAYLGLEEPGPKPKKQFNIPGKTVIKITAPQPYIATEQQIIPQPTKNKRNWHYAGAMGAVWDQNGKKLTEGEYQRVMAGEQVIPEFKKGGKMKYCAPKAKNGLSIENDAYSQISPSMLQIEGDSHANGGTNIDFMGKIIEAEKGEPITFDKEGNLTIFGNLNNPLTNNKYKKDAKMLAKKENKAKVYFDKGLELIKTEDPKGKYSAYAFNAGKVMMEGGKQKLDEVMQAKEHLGELQNAHLQLIGEEENTAKNGIKMYTKGGKTDPPAKWKFNNTNTKGLDAKILEFVKLAEQKGLGGYSGPQSGVSQRNTKSGKLSRHAQKQALDMIFSDKDAYNKILSDPDLSGYLINNGLTAINEYDPSIAKKTGSTLGHIHIGYDKGTSTADKFRQDAKSKWSSQNPNWKWDSRMPATGKPLKGAPSGDVYDFPPAIKQPYTDKSGFTPVLPSKYSAPQPEKVVAPQKLNNYVFNFTQNQRTPYSNAKPLDLTNVLGEAYSLATNQQEPVFMQQYQPDLYQDYQVSFQDRVNQNNRTFNAAQQLIGYNPQALSSMSAELYGANNQVAAEEFRTNQGIVNDITNKNISLLNEAKGINLKLADTQYVRQSQAKSNTKVVNQQALNSISSKVLQNKKENNALRTFENLYPNFRFDNNYKKDFVGAPASEVIDWGGMQSNNYSKEVETVNPDGSIKQIKRTTEAQSPIDLQLKKEKLKQIIQNITTPNFEKGGKVNGRKWLSLI